ncbi:MAG: hypothetical protein WBD20_27975 [Pirellulaceae bacterium]
MTDSVTAELESEISELMGQDVRVDVEERREFDQTSVAVVKMSYTETVTTDDSRHSVNIRETAVVLKQPDLILPDFTLRPSASGIAGKIFSLFGDMGDINFDESPEFSSAYFLHGWIEETVRTLFVPELRNYFAKDSRWSVRGQDNTLILYHRKKLIREDERDQFIQDALHILTLFQLGEEALDASPELRRQTRPEDMVRTAERMTGIVGTMMQRQLDVVRLTKSEVDAYAATSPPRVAPSGMKRQSMGQWGPVIGAGIVIFLFGAVFVFITGFLAEAEHRWLALPMLAAPILGLVITFFATRYRIKKMRILRSGVLHSGVVTSVKRTEVSINEQRQYKVTIECDNQNQIECKVLGKAGDYAKAMQESGERVRVLVDPTDESHTLCLDLLLIFDER